MQRIIQRYIFDIFRKLCSVLYSDTYLIFKERQKLQKVCLTHISLVDFSTLINWTSPFSILGMPDVFFFHFYFIFDKNSC